MPQSNAKYVEGQIRQHRLVGAVLAGAHVVPSEDDPGEEYLVLEFRRADGKMFTATVMCDPEGNGPGFLDLSGPT